MKRFNLEATNVILSKTDGRVCDTSFQLKKVQAIPPRKHMAHHLLDLFVNERKLTRGDIQVECGHHDANQLLHVLRNEMHVPVACQKGRDGQPSFWFMTDENINMYKHRRSEQVMCQKHKNSLRDKAKTMKSIHQWVEEMGEEEFIQLVKEASKKKVATSNS